MLNRVVLTGRLTRDPELRQLNNNMSVMNFRLAVDRQFRNNNGERDADFINCVVWRKAAENLAHFTHKGSLIGIDGRLTTSQYTDKNGNNVFQTEVSVDSFALLEPKPKGNQQGNSNQTYQTNNQTYSGNYGSQRGYQNISGQQGYQSQQQPTNGGYNNQPNYQANNQYNNQPRLNDTPFP